MCLICLFVPNMSSSYFSLFYFQFFRDCISAWNRAAGVQFLRLGLSLFEQDVSFSPVLAALFIVINHLKFIRMHNIYLHCYFLFHSFEYYRSAVCSLLATTCPLNLLCIHIYRIQKEINWKY